MDAWVIWVIAGIVLGIGEIFTLSLYLLPFAGGAFLAAATSAAGANQAIALAVFIVASVLLLTTLRPIARRHRRMPPRIRTNTQALIGRSAVVEQLTDGTQGLVKIEGQTWTARAYDEDDVYQPGQRVSVMEIRGVTALVSD